MDERVWGETGAVSVGEESRAVAVLVVAAAPFRCRFRDRGAHGIRHPSRARRHGCSGATEAARGRGLQARGARARLQLGRVLRGRDAERASRADHDPPAEKMIAGPAHSGADAERQRLADDRRATLRGELVDEGRLQSLDERADGGAGERLGDELAPVSVAADALAGQLPTDLYGINGIPQIILFGPDGTIVARDLRGEAIGEKVGECLAK